MTTIDSQRSRAEDAPVRRFQPLRSVLAVVAGFVAVIVLSLVTDQIFHSLHVFPPWDKPMDDAGDNLLALTYRCVYAVVGSYITARLAPSSPMWHVWIWATIGFILSIGGIIAALNVHLGPIWYPVALTLTTFPCAWMGGLLHRKWHGE
ncbi:MAG TPA: hypothetical protein VFB96_15035 [Pirellulaceae bacterium]|jgi:hypothetical protein|nr:hypothetical protein [Pirellulaceae bacterium]